MATKTLSGDGGYQRQLMSHSAETIRFQPVTLEDCVATLRSIGDDGTASAFHHRYLDFERVKRAIFGQRITVEDVPVG
ncbi:hypothetical protein C9I56_28560 [Paraburkholderia caribensis]|uniref:Uncharacterized protein n=1 Tax=Paraburkholderia caribensis TaxID=75105 RepID=A0A9Q6WLI4_9BURK|nr:hypothetical protein C9I56_28560 [Paraburkholderia caribensis]QLB62883.1 hypothetical protein A9O66_11105 [Paraburkholderia caribensis]